MSRAAAEFDAEDGIVDARTLDQRRADLLVDFVVGDFIDAEALAGGTPAERLERRVARGLDLGRFAGIRPTVIVTVPVDVLLDRTGVAATGLGRDVAGPPTPDRGATDPPTLDGIVPIDPATARELVANASSLYRMLVDRHTGVRLDLSRERYEVPTALRMWLRLRDATCRFPGCGRPAKGCDIDHSVDWQFGGETRADNLAHLCRGHHTLKHQTRWQLVQHADGEITWRSPSGRTYSTRPAQPFTRGLRSDSEPVPAARGRPRAPH